jgi:hypothetical protein
VPVDLGEAGRRTEGLAAAQEAVKLYEELAEGDREMFGPLAEEANDLLSWLRDSS